ncbi:hypothetical protein QAD02_022570 [Eretmocerus hayati]|uniref:Uncharacterized protein n=1 Tax=Eretmocerus hayati TaxID=131215 RepID=A0ACC2PV04_9HYME|nr:hypothetical protein QAD02_022570 [Eretmocerus hayati]
MAASALVQEKVWLDKTSYDKAERLHYEKLAKVLHPKTVSDFNILATNENQAAIPTTKTKGKKAKDNKSVSQDGSSETSKNSKNLKKSSKKKESSSSGNSKTEGSPDNDVLKTDSQSTTSSAVDVKKCKAKEAKEKKNKADKKQKNVENDGYNSQDQLINQGGQSSVCSISAGGSLANEVAKARQHIKQSLQCMDGIAALAGVSDKDLVSRVVSLEKENQDLRNIVQELKSIVLKLDNRVETLEGQSTKGPAPNSKPVLQICPQKPPAKDDDDEDVDLFGSDSEGEDAEAAKIREERLAAYAAKKSNKPVLIAKSSIILDVKPWDDETDMKAMEAEVRKIKADGLLWGAAKLMPVAYKIQKLQISCVVEDDKVSVDWLTEKIESLEDFVQSVDIAAFNKV